MSGIMKFAGTVLKNLIHKPVTENYPQAEREYPERTRGKVSIDISQCVFCTLCAKQCPTGAITVDRAAQTWTIDPFGCIQCRYCVDHCPRKCLSMEQHYTSPSEEKTVETYTKQTTEEKQEEKEHA